MAVSVGTGTGCPVEDGVGLLGEGKGVNGILAAGSKVGNGEKVKVGDVDNGGAVAVVDDISVQLESAARESATNIALNGSNDFNILARLFLIRV